MSIFSALKHCDSVEIEKHTEYILQNKIRQGVTTNVQRLGMTFLLHQSISDYFLGLSFEFSMHLG